MAKKPPLHRRNERAGKRIAAPKFVKAKRTARPRDARNPQAAPLDAEQQLSAIREILQVMSSSPTDLQPVLDAVAASAARLCGASDAIIRLRDGDALRSVASYGPLPYTHVFFVNRGTAVGRAVVDGRTVHIEDYAAKTEDDFPDGKEVVQRLGFRTVLATPLLRENVAIGAISIRRVEVRPFTEKQIKLLETFAAQAVIAIENVRLFNETKEALERQTATSEILSVISNSPTDTQPVFDAIVQSGLKLFSNAAISVALPDGDNIRAAAVAESDPARAEAWRRRFPTPLTREYMHGVALLDRRIVDIPDVANAPPEFAAGSRNFLASGYRAMTIMPMMRGEDAIGALSVVRIAPGPLSDKQLDVLKTFADQAVIAVENTRLLKELRQRTDDLSESLQQQTATAEVLKVISRSTFNLQSVLETLVESAARLCEADMASVARQMGEVYRQVAWYGYSPEFAAFMATHPLEPGRGTLVGRTVIEGKAVQIQDVLADPAYIFTPGAIVRGVRTMLGVPLLREGTPIGVIVLSRKTVRPFTDKQIELVSTFADQAVIAIENVRLFNETNEALARQTATAEILRVISSSPTDIQPVLDAVAESAARLCEASDAVIHFRHGDDLRNVAHHGTIEAMPLGTSRKIVRGSIPGRAVLEARQIHVNDVLAEENEYPDAFVLARKHGHRTTLVTPLLRKGEAIGTIVVRRTEVRPFNETQSALVRTFADQAVIAIENVRLFHEIEEKSRQLEQASRHKSDFLASMSHELRTPLNAILGFNEMLLGQIYGEVPSAMQEPLADIQASGKHLLRLINNVLDLAKIEAGRMELALSDYSVHDIVESVRSTLRPLAAEKGLEFLATVPADVPLAYGDPGRITQCLMNLAGNSLKFTKAGKVEISVALNDGTLAYRVADTGIGIPPDKIDGLFTEFKQTDATIASEYGGTGLGLSISRKFVEMHGGRIWVESELGKGSAFIFEMPLRLNTGAQA